MAAILKIGVRIPLATGNGFEQNRMTQEVDYYRLWTFSAW